MFASKAPIAAQPPPLSKPAKRNSLNQTSPRAGRLSVFFTPHHHTTNATKRRRITFIPIRGTLGFELQTLNFNCFSIDNFKNRRSLKGFVVLLLATRSDLTFLKFKRAMSISLSSGHTKVGSELPQRRELQWHFYLIKVIRKIGSYP